MGQVNIRVPDDEVDQVRASLKDAAASLGISQGELLKRAVSSVVGIASAEPSKVDAVMQRKIDERTARSMSSQAPSTSSESIPGVQRGMPRRESGSERVARERREKLDRTAALDSVDDPSIDRSDEYVSQS